MVDTCTSVYDEFAERRVVQTRFDLELGRNPTRTVRVASAGCQPARARPPERSGVVSRASVCRRQEDPPRRGTGALAVESRGVKCRFARFDSRLDPRAVAGHG